MPEPKKKPAAGTRKPIYVSNPNAPRLKSYQDSLGLYNRFKNDKVNYFNFIKSQGLDDKHIQEWSTDGYVDTDIHPKIGAISYGMLENTGGGFKRDKIPGPATYFTNYPRKDGSQLRVLDDSELNKRIRERYSVYKKPVQPVEYKGTEKAIVKPKNAELSVKKKELKPQKSLPKSVTGFKMDASGVNVYLSVNGKQTVMPKKEFTSWLQNPENRAMYDKYRSSQAKTLKKK